MFKILNIFLKTNKNDKKHEKITKTQFHIFV